MEIPTYFLINCYEITDPLLETDKNSDLKEIITSSKTKLTHSFLHTDPPNDFLLKVKGG